MLNTTQFKNDIIANTTSTGFICRQENPGSLPVRIRVDIGKKTAVKMFMPITEKLLNVFGTKATDTAAVGAAKAVARGMTYFATPFTMPLQTVFYGLPKNLASKKELNEYAKSILGALESYNTLRHKVTLEADHQVNYLAAENVEGVGRQIDENGRIVIEISPREKAKIKDRLELLQREKIDKYDVIIKEQVSGIVKYLISLPAENRLEAHKELLGAFMNHVGFDHLFIRDDERLEFALMISNQIGLSLIEQESAAMITKLARNFNFIEFNQALEKLGKDVATLFGIDEKLALTLVSQQLKQQVERQYPSLESFLSTAQAHLSDVITADNPKLRVALQSILHNYSHIIDQIKNKYSDLKDGAIFKDATEATKLLQDIDKLKKKQKRANQELLTINGKLQALAKKKSFYHLVKIKETKETLIQKRKENEDLLKQTNKQIQDLIGELFGIDNMKDVDFNPQEVKDLKTSASDKLEKERQIREFQLNLGDKNIRAFRAFKQLLVGVDTKTDAENQTTLVSSLVDQLNNQLVSFDTVTERVMKTLGLKSSRSVSFYEVIRNHVASFPADSDPELFREIIRSLYEKLSERQKGRLALEVALQSGQEQGYFRQSQNIAFGKEAIKQLINGDFSKIVAIRKAVESREVKESVEKKPFFSFSS